MRIMHITMDNKKILNLIKLLIPTVFIVKIIVIFVVLPHLSVLLSGLYSNSNFPDGYDKIAINISNGAGYRFYPDTAETVLREPGYPFVLSVLFSWFGYTLLPVQVLNVIMGVVASFFVYKISQRISQKPWVPYLSVLLYMMNPGTIIVESRGGPEALFTFLVVCLVYFLIRALKRPSYTRWFIVGGFIGISCLVKSILILFPFAIVIYLIIKNNDSYAIRDRLLHVGAVFLSVSVILSPWVIRNYKLTGQFIPTASVVGVSAHAGQYICENLSIDNGFAKLDGKASIVRGLMAKNDGLKFRKSYYNYYYSTNDEVYFNRKLLKEVMDKYKQYPMLAMQCMGANLFHFWFSGKTWNVTTANFIVQFPYIALALVGIFVSIYQRSEIGTVLAFFILYYYSVHIPILAQARYSIPLFPFISILAVLGLSHLIHLLRKGKEAYLENSELLCDN
jgi:hypothetical protein